MLHLVIPGSVHSPEPGLIACDPVTPKLAQVTSQRSVVGQDRAALAGRQELDRMEGEHGQVGELSDGAPSRAAPRE